MHKSAITDNVAQHNHVIDWEGAKVINKDSNKQTKWMSSGSERGGRKSSTAMKELIL